MKSITNDNLTFSTDKSYKISSFVDSAPEIKIDDITDFNLESKSFQVSEHLRNLPSNQKPSLEKLALAAERGITLESGQTLVDSYVKGKIAA